MVALDELRLSAADLGGIIGVSERRVREMRDQGVIADIGRGQYALGEAVRAYCAFLRPAKAGSAHGGSTASGDLTVERARLAKAQADAQDMRNAETRRELLRREDVDAAVGASFARVRARLVAIPAKVAPVVATIDSANEAQAVVRDAIHEALRELADTTIEDLIAGDDE